MLIFWSEDDTRVLWSPPGNIILRTQPTNKQTVSSCSAGSWYDLNGKRTSYGDIEAFCAWSLAAAEDALLAGALVRRAEANEQPSLLVLLLLLKAVVRLALQRFAAQVRGRSRFQPQLLLYHLPGKETKLVIDWQLDWWPGLDNNILQHYTNSSFLFCFTDALCLRTPTLGLWCGGFLQWCGDAASTLFN